MLNKRILIAALTLALCTTAFASCGRNTETDGTGGTTDSITESAAPETESGKKETTGESNTESSENGMGGTVTEGMGTNGTTGTEGTTGIGGTTSTEGTTGIGGTTGTEGTTGIGGTTGTEGAGGIVGRIGNDAQNGMNNVKRGVEDIFDGNRAMPERRGHRPPVPFGK